VPSNARLVKGLFNESLPAFLSELDAASRQSPAVFRNVTFLHIDCDLVRSLAPDCDSRVMTCSGVWRFECTPRCVTSLPCVNRYQGLSAVT
jgi:hypothetical protein